MKYYGRKALALVLSAILIASTASTAFAQDPVEKDEVVYINLSHDGSVESIYVVNAYDLTEEQPVTDFGNYREVKNLTTTEELSVQDGAISFTAPKGKFYYQGELDSRPFQEAVETVVGRRVTVQAKTDWAAGLSSYEVSFPGDVALTTQEQMGLTATLASTFPENEIALDSALVLKAAVGWDFWLKCLLCMGVAAAVTVLFFSLRFPSIGGWQAGILTVAAFAHNLLLAAGGYALFRIPFGGQFFAVALVILFFTLYSAAGLFGHIRDNRRLLGKKVSPEHYAVPAPAADGFGLCCYDVGRPFSDGASGASRRYPELYLPIVGRDSFLRLWGNLLSRSPLGWVAGGKKL